MLTPGKPFKLSQKLVSKAKSLPKSEGIERSGNTKGGSIIVPLTSCLTGLESVVRQLTTDN